MIKPTLLGGNGVVLGWMPGLTAQEWRGHVEAALGSPYVLQRRVRPTPQLFPNTDGDLQPWNLLWGVFSVVTGYGGANVRATPAGLGDVVANRAHGIHSGPTMCEASAA